MMSVNKIISNGLEHPAKPIHWQEGLFLQPHHFQWQDLYFQSQIDPLNRYLQPSFWGVGQLAVLEEALSNHIFDVLSGEFRFRDLTHAIYPGNAVLESRNFEKAWKDKGKPFTVYLGVRKLSRNGKNVSDPQDYESFSIIPTRYAGEKEAEHLSDLYAGGEELPIERMRYVLKILWEDEMNTIGDYEIIPIARLESRKGEIIIMPDYIPPVLSLSSCEALMQNIKTINELITSTANRLETQKKDRGVHTAEFGTKDMVFLFTLRTLNRFSPLLRHMLGKASAVHPWTVYGLMCQLVGELSTFSSKINLINISKDSPYYLLDYDHEDLTRCFKRSRYILGRLMADIASEPEYVIPFSYNGQYFSADLTPKLVQGRKRYYLVIETEATQEQVVTELENQAKMSSPKHLSMLILQSLRGIELKHIVHPPPELPRRNTGAYFSINHKNRLWGKVVEDLKLVLSWDTRPKDARIELMVAGGDV
jgi:type VI secretion system protein ImpJ